MNTYTCPMHPEVVRDKAGQCPKCGMDLVLRSELSKEAKQSSADNNYTPIIVVIAFIIITCIAVGIRQMDLGLTNFVTNFMIGFFLVFSGFKLIDLKGFATGYANYDLLAKRWFAYGYIYPFIELFFALAMILDFFPKQVLMAEVLVMGFSGFGVALKIAKKERFKCACLGTVLKVPLTYVTLNEDFGMAFLALFMLLQ